MFSNIVYRKASNTLIGTHFLLMTKIIRNHYIIKVPSIIQ